MFDTQIKPLLLYGSEIWGLKEYKSVEKVHTSALKKLLNVNPRTPNDLAYGETGRFPLYVHCYTACIKYWLRLTTMDISRKTTSFWGETLSVTLLRQNLELWLPVKLLHPIGKGGWFWGESLSLTLLRQKFAAATLELWLYARR